MKSLLITITEIQLGIKPMTDKEIKLDASSNLSAIGSMKAPSFVCLFRARAKNPSKMSVNPAIVNVISADLYDSCIKKIIITGTRIMRSKDRKLGKFIKSFYIKVQYFFMLFLALLYINKQYELAA